MSARVLVVDDLQTNLKVLEAKLAAEYFDVLTADSGAKALELVTSELPDIVLLDVMMPEMDGFEVCKRLKSDPKTAHIPVVMVTALSDVSDRVTGLEAGADDFLTKPVDDLALFARIKSLVRLKMVIDEWRLREETCDQFGVLSEEEITPEEKQPQGNVLIIESSELESGKIRDRLLSEGNSVVTIASAKEGLEIGSQDDFDLIVVSLELDDGDGLRLCSQFRSLEKTRQIPILLMIEPEETEQLVKGFELGVTDYLVRPIDGNELKARTRTQICHKHYHDRLRDNYQRSLSLALTDNLTGLYNQRYLSAHLETLIQRSLDKGQSLALLLIDIDFFKKVNDTHGHGVGDEVLRDVATRISRNCREFDLAARMGGEEFVTIMPNSNLAVAEMVAERLRGKIADIPFAVSADVGSLEVTVSIGVALTIGDGDTAANLLERADKAMYEAKEGGRNRIAVDQALDAAAPDEVAQSQAG